MKTTAIPTRKPSRMSRGRLCFLIATAAVSAGCAGFFPAQRPAVQAPATAQRSPPMEIRQRPVETTVVPDLGRSENLSPQPEVERSLELPQERDSVIPAENNAVPTPAVEPLSSPEEPPLRGPRILPQQIFVPSRLQLSVKAPERKQVGSGATYVLTVRNMGDEPVEDAVVTCEFDESLSFSGRTEHKVRQTLGRLGPGEHKELPLSLVSQTPGPHCCRFEAASADLEPVHAEACVEFVPRELGAVLKGPETRSVGDRAEFTLLLTNLSPRPIRQIRVRMFYDGALSPHAASAGAEIRSGSIGWTIAELPPGQAVPLHAEFVCDHRSEQSCLVTEIRADGIPEDEIEACLGIEAGAVPLSVRIEDATDPVKVGGTTEYLVAVRNAGLEPLRRVILTADVPPQFRVTNVEVRAGNQLIESSAEVSGTELAVSPVELLLPEGTLIYRIRVTAHQPGTAELTVHASHAADETKVTRGEVTVVIP